jgi:succinate dehydrogenase/fumarate reductase flavoprotein subunit
MTEAGILDSRKDALTYLRLVARGQADDELIVAYVDHCNEMLSFIESHTHLEFEFYRRGVHPFPDYHPEWSGGKPGGRGIAPKTYRNLIFGRALMQGLRDAIEARDIPIWLRSPARRLVLDESGAVTGVQVQRLDRRLLDVRARKGIILACGGFEWNPELVRHYLRGPSPITNTLPNANTGDGLLMALGVGADLRNMNEAWGVPMYQVPGQKIGLADWFTWRGKPGAIMVNRHGKRFCNESADYNSTWRSFFTWENWGTTGYASIPAFTIVDQRMVDRYGFAARRPGEIPEWVTRADSLRELAEKLGIDPEGLETTVAEFNRWASASPPRDLEFHRGESLFDRIASGDSIREEGTAASLGPLEGPLFCGAAIWPGNCGTCGGPRVNAWGQVINPFGEVILGLYAAGNAAGIGGPGAGEAGSGGGTIGPAMTFGFLAANHAANR